MNKLTYTHLAAAVMLTAAALAHGDDKSRPEMETIQVYGQKTGSLLSSEENTATRLGLTVLETPQSISVISREQMDNLGLNNLNDALSSTSTVQVEAVETDRTYYTARGFDITNFQIDGVGVPTTYGNIAGDIDTAVFERIEVVHGANGLMSGAGNPSATINMIRKRPTDTLSLAFTGAAGSWDKTRADADISGPLGNGIRGRLVMAREDRESWLDNYALDKNLAYGVLETNLTANTTLTGGLTYQESNADSPLWGALPLYYSDGTQTDYTRSTSTAADWAYWDNEYSNGFVELAHDFNERWALKLSYQHNRLEGDSELFYMFGTPDPVTEVGLTGYASSYQLDDKRDLVDIYLTGAFDFAGREHEIVLGANWSDVRVEDRSRYDFSTGRGFPAIGDFRQWAGDTPHPVLADGCPGCNGSDFRDEQLGLYAATRLKLTESLSLVTGARVVDWESEGESYGVSQATEANGKTLPYGGLVYRLRDDISLYGSYTETFMPQNEIGTDRRRLAPNEGTNSELGVKGAFLDGRLNATLAVFRTEHSNLAEVAFFDTTIGGNVHVGRDYESEGFEIQLNAQPVEGLMASLSYTDLTLENDAGDKARTFIPRKTLNLSASYQPHFLPRLQVGATLDWQDDIYRNQSGAAGITEQDSYALVHAFARYQFSEQWSMALNVRNITDEKYLTSLYWDQGYYGAPANATLSISWRY